ncbi:MAG: nucleoside triphosphate pyrophosphohydrolase [Congregibacter sp.]
MSVSNNVPYSLDDLLRIMQRLRDPETGCPWDVQQNFETIVPSTLEECYELAAAIEAGDLEHLPDELGDVLFQVVFYAQLGNEQNLFDFQGVVHGLCSKLLRRHPHVFADGDIESIVDMQADSAQVKQRWEEIKAEERADRAQHSALDDVPLALPALPRAQKLQKRASRVGFDWADHPPVVERLQEELTELAEALNTGTAADIEDEMGDVLFTVVNLARHLKVDAESALRRSSQKFERRFRSVEAEAAARGASIESFSPEMLDELWAAAKATS